MFCCHSATRRETILASLSGCATIAGVALTVPDPSGPADMPCVTSCAGAVTYSPKALSNASKRPVSDDGSIAVIPFAVSARAVSPLPKAAAKSWSK